MISVVFESLMICNYRLKHVISLNYSLRFVQFVDAVAPFAPIKRTEIMLYTESCMQSRRFMCVAIGAWPTGHVDVERKENKSITYCNNYCVIQRCFVSFCLTLIC